MKKLKWFCLQPLTGGMYIGSENAIGHKAEAIISFPGFGDITKNPKCDRINAGNEYNLLKYLEKKNDLTTYKIFKQKPFDDEELSKAEIYDHAVWGKNNKDLDFTDTDIVTAVPVCSGLSTATIGTDETKNARNCNMVQLARYALGTIKPKVYIFENAPTLFSERGESVREQLEDIAEEYGYSVAYYKTDTQLHGVPQRRPRTFIYFFKWRNGKKEGVPMLNFTDVQDTMEHYFSLIPEDASQQTPVVHNVLNNMLLKYARSKWGDNWRDEIADGKDNTDLIFYIIKHNLMDECLDWITNNYDDIKPEYHIPHITKIFKHIKTKLDMGLGFYSNAPVIHRKIMPAIMFKSMIATVHPTEDRCLTIRECLHLMGMPNEFELYGSDDNYPKIGQNVPVKTAQYIVSEAVRIVNNWDNEDRSLGLSKGYAMFDNIKKKVA